MRRWRRSDNSDLTYHVGDSASMLCFYQTWCRVLLALHDGNSEQQVVAYSDRNHERILVAGIQLVSEPSKSVRRDRAYVNDFTQFVSWCLKKTMSLFRNPKCGADPFVYDFSLGAMFIRRQTGHQFTTSNVVVAFVMLDHSEWASVIEMKFQNFL
ncbi:hypothetical protein [Actinomadura alba]|uniref:Uncharacterized protein n=1 Tax=Actinomadura alba TaxID=406431 RepID=A0ABR7LII1_9ACTN|nr:hypothetical protein [Actinomadura alba]MBC6464647.1 hypothetical protein [Actinomadura alba]